MNPRLTILFVIFSFLILSPLSTLASPDTSEPPPPIERVQSRMLKNMKLADFKLEGYLRTEKKKYPIVLRTKGYELIYEFQKTPLQIRVLLDPEKSTVQMRKKSSASWETLKGRQLLQPILDTDLTYEDLAMDFVRWEKVRPLGTDSIKTLKSWAYQATPTSTSQYAQADYWISADHYVFLRVDGKNKNNQVIKRVEINGVQKIDEVYVIKEMQISSMVPGTERSKSRTWIDIREGKLGASGL